MLRVALLSALVALAEARIYERCELARDLLALGVDKDHVATWVCIAYHESRFDTAARNAGSGDHGLLQISELYWCGPGKACGVPCSSFRDENISDDVECALKIYREHTRLQGNGFLAWVVYPHHCKTNAKKYIVDCDKTIRTSKYDDRARNLKASEENATKLPVNSANLHRNQPRYLTINSIVQENYIKELERNYNNDGKETFSWINFKVDNIDDLQLPAGVEHPPNLIMHTVTTRPTTTTTTDPELVGIKPPSPRKIESNQFRRRKTFSELLFTKNKFDYDYEARRIRLISTEKTPQKSSTNKPLTYEDLADNPFLNNSPTSIFKTSVAAPRREPKFTDGTQYNTNVFTETANVPLQADKDSKVEILTFEDLLQNPFLKSLPALSSKSLPQQKSVKGSTVKLVDTKNTPSARNEDDTVTKSLSIEDLLENPFLKHLTSKVNLNQSIRQPVPAYKITTNAPEVTKDFSSTILTLPSTTLTTTTTYREAFTLDSSTTVPLTVSGSRGKVRFMSDVITNTVAKASTQNPTILTTIVQQNDLKNQTGRFHINQNISYKNVTTVAAVKEKTYEESSTVKPAININHNRNNYRLEASTQRSPSTFNRLTTYASTVTPKQTSTPPPKTSTTLTTTLSPNFSRRFWEVSRSTQATTSRPMWTWTTSSRASSSATTASTSLISSSPKVVSSTEATTVKTTQSIFDLYLRPTRPTFKPFNFTWSSKRVQIFSGGTTRSPKL